MERNLNKNKQKQGKKYEALKQECWKWDVEVLIWWVRLVLNSLIGMIWFLRVIAVHLICHFNDKKLIQTIDKCFHENCAWCIIVSPPWELHYLNCLREIEMTNSENFLRLFKKLVSLDYFGVAIVFPLLLWWLNHIFITRDNENQLVCLDYENQSLRSLYYKS